MKIENMAKHDLQISLSIPLSLLVFQEILYTILIDRFQPHLGIRECKVYLPFHPCRQWLPHINLVNNLKQTKDIVDKIQLVACQTIWLEPDILDGVAPGYQSLALISDKTRSYILDLKDVKIVSFVLNLLEIGTALIQNISSLV